MLASSSSFVAAAAAGMALFGGVAVNAQVTATGTMGTTNPPQATLGTPLNQSSFSRLLSLNSVQDFCLFAPPYPGVNSTIGDTEAIEVAWCTLLRNDARLIPDDTFYAAHFVTTPLYVQITGFGDFTKINIPYGDEGGELDPHGATGLGNPIGGNVTSNVTGSDVSYQEWMNYMSYQEFCLRICTAENSTYSAALECEHTLDEMGCEWVMPGNYDNGTFTQCDGDSAYPPGVYPEANGSTSTFAQRYTGTYTDSNGETEYWTVGYTVTPQTPYMTPASSNCQTFTSISNGVTGLAVGAVSSTASASASGSGSNSGSRIATMTAAASTGGSSNKASSSGAASTGSSSSASTSKAGAASIFRSNESFGPTVAVAFSAFALVAGAGALFL